MSSESQIEGKREIEFSKLGSIQMELCNCNRRGTEKLPLRLVIITM